jgi:hypothetical protein
MAVKRQLFAAGDLFCVPLPSGGYGLGLIARKSPAGIVLGYFFRCRFDTCPGLDDLTRIGKRDVVLMRLFGGVGLARGDWPILGPLPGWQPGEWPMPTFGWKLSLGQEAYVRREYSEDPARMIREVRIGKDEFERLPEDGVDGFLALAIGLEAILREMPDRN